jgi:hypothetical protein
MENLMCATEALTKLGINKKSGPSTVLLKKVGIEPVFAKKIGRGSTVFVKCEDVEAAVEKAEKARAERRAAQGALRLNQKTSNDEVLEALNRLETKIDKLLLMWEDK